MVCARCAQAADRRADASEHCPIRPGPGAGCSCQHRVDRYRKTETEEEQQSPRTGSLIA